MTPRKKWLWRCGVIAAGFAWSAVLWHQQVISDVTAHKDQESIVTSAVTKANEHSDEQIGAVRKDVQEVKGDLGDTTRRLSDLFIKTGNDISTSIGRVSNPAPPVLARIEFSLWKDDINSSAPQLTKRINQDNDGATSVDLIFTNVSDTPADALEAWLNVGDVCSFAEEPPGFDRPAGMGATERHLNVPILNAGVTYGKITVKVKCAVAPPYPLGLAFRYSCKTCGRMSAPQTATIAVLPHGQPTLPWQR
jgi:hypothetical protein